MIKEPSNLDTNETEESVHIPYFRRGIACKKLFLGGKGVLIRGVLGERLHRTPNLLNTGGFNDLSLSFCLSLAVGCTVLLLVFMSIPIAVLALGL